MRATALWYRTRLEQFVPLVGQRGVAHLRHHACDFLITGEGQPLVLVPGLAGGYELLSPLVRVLARRFQVICFQLRGETDAIQARQPHTWRDLADDLADLLDALLLERPTIAGVSFGSAVALEFALRHPRRASGLVLHGLEPRFRNRLGCQIARLALENYPLPHDNAFFNQFFRLLFARREQVGPLFDFVTSRCWSTDQIVMAHRLSLLAEFDVRDRLVALELPALMIAGEDDSVVTAAGQRELAESIPGGRFASIPAAGHLCFLTHPGAFSEWVSKFLAQSRHLVET